MQTSYRMSLVKNHVGRGRGRVFRAHFGGPFGGPGFRPAAPRQQGGAQAQAGNPVLQLLHLLPVLALLLFTLLSSPGQPVRGAVHQG